jgi:hypothetical protein
VRSQSILPTGQRTILRVRKINLEEHAAYLLPRDLATYYSKARAAIRIASILDAAEQVRLQQEDKQPHHHQD